MLIKVEEGAGGAESLDKEGQGKKRVRRWRKKKKSTKKSRGEF